jgi:hypothetical protein
MSVGWRSKAWLWFHPNILRVLHNEDRWHVEHTDALVALRALPDNCIDSCVTDPPSGISFMGKDWDRDKGGRNKWIAWLTEIMREVLRVLKPGAHAFVWALPRTSHWTGMALENAGFEVRDSFDHIFSTGFPKSLNVSKAIDDAAGAERQIVGTKRGKGGANLNRLARADGNDSEDAKGCGAYGTGAAQIDVYIPVTAPATAAAKQLNGWGTAAKPAHEVWWLVRKPLAGTVAANVLEYGTGAINVDDCRVAHASPADLEAHEQQVATLKDKGGVLGNSWKNSSDLSGANEVNTAGRWPPNLLFSHQPECRCIGTVEVDANPTWDTPNRATEPSKFTGSEISPVRHATRAGEASADRRYTKSGVTGFAALPGRRDPYAGSGDYTEVVEQWKCIDGCPVRELSLQSGRLTSGTGARMNAAAGLRGNSLGTESRPAGTAMIEYGDTGTAARFFPQFQQSELDDLTPFLYQAKPSTSERDRGLEAFRVLSGGDATGRKDGSAGTQSPRAGAGRTGGRRNHHATVKSVELIRWLTRLITPPGGLVVDPFAGSGTGGIAALRDGYRWLGFELNDDDEEPSVSVARARISWCEGREYIPRPSLRAKDSPAKLSLLGLFNKD